MRISRPILLGSIAALAVIATPALAKNSDAQKATEKSTSSGCQAYQMAADGTWTALPCQESGSSSQTQKSSAHGAADEGTH